MNLLTLLVLDSVLQGMGELIRKYLKKKEKEIENVSIKASFISSWY